MSADLARATGSAQLLSAVENFFEEELGPSVLKRVGRMSVEDFAPLRETLETGVGFWDPPERPLGHLRPFVFVPGLVFEDDPLWEHAHRLFPPQRLEQHLLYFHEVAVSDPMLPSVSGAYGSSAPLDAMCWLTYAAPLIRAGLVHLQDWRVRRSTMSNWRPLGSSERFIRSDAWVSAYECHEIEALLVSLGALPDNPQALGALLRETSAAADVRRALLGTLAQPAGAADLWLPRFEYGAFAHDILNALSRNVSFPVVPPQERLDVMTQISRVDLPVVSALSLSDLLAIRRNEDVFNTWRDDLAATLCQLPSDRPPSESEIATADQSLRQASTRVVTAKSIKAVVVEETRTLGLGAMGSGVSWGGLRPYAGA